MEETEDEISLEIEGTVIGFEKKVLIENSDYFKAMFEGNFSERDKSTIKLEGIEYNSMRIIRILLYDNTYMIDNADILVVLQTACMLQFEWIRESCVDRLTETLSPENCVRVWFMTEPLDLRPLYLKAKNLALMEFEVVKETDCFVELNLRQLHAYLGNVYLRCDDEMDVFNTCMRWYYESSSGRATLDELLSCVDFARVSANDVKVMTAYPDVRDDKRVAAVLECVLDLKLGERCDWDGEVLRAAERLVGCRRRTTGIPSHPLLFVGGPGVEQSSVYVYDRYLRKNKCVKLEKNSVGDHAATVLIYDERNDEMLRCFDVPTDKLKGYEGFHVVGYKELMFMFGGETTIGTGSWNLNFWVYDTIRSRWERKTKLPTGRRHFQTCVCGNYLYIIGGTGSFRIVQNNMVWYNYKENIWSKQILLPCHNNRQLTCCNYKNQLLLLNISDMSAYLFVSGENRFVTLNVADDKKLVANYPDRFTLFSYGDRIYIKGSTLIEMELFENELKVTSVRDLAPVNCDQMESVVCRDTVYTLYRCQETRTTALEAYSMTRHEAAPISHGLPSGNPTKLTSIQHHVRMDEPDVYVNDL